MVEAKCEMCSEAKAEAFCRQCAMFICAECVKQHQRMKVFAGHKTSSLDELKEGGASDIVIQEPTLQMCEQHNQPMNMFCFGNKCLTCICRDCTIIDHRGHKYEFIKKAAPAMKKRLGQQLKLLEQTKQTLSCAMKQIQTTRSEVKAQGQSVADHIKSSFDELYQTIETRKQQLLAESAEETTRKLDHLSSQEENVSTSCAVVQSVIEYTQQCLEHSADDEIMCMLTELQARMKKEMVNEVKLVEEANMAVEVSCVEDLRKLCQSKARLTYLNLQRIPERASKNRLNLQPYHGTKYNF